jgi:hypothetical protein
MFIESMTSIKAGLKRSFQRIGTSNGPGTSLGGVMKLNMQNFISGSGDKRGHGKTPLFMAGMKCLPLCKVPLLSAANNCVQPIAKYISRNKGKKAYYNQ